MIHEGHDKGCGTSPAPETPKQEIRPPPQEPNKNGDIFPEGNEPCACEICQLSNITQRIMQKCTPEEKAAIETLWMRMEASETTIDWNKGKAKDGEPLIIGGRRYVPDNSGLAPLDPMSINGEEIPPCKRTLMELVSMCTAPLVQWGHLDRHDALWKAFKLGRLYEQQGGV